MARVLEIMKRDVPSISPSASIVEAAQKFRDCGIEILPVCENGKLRGIITERDIVIGIVATASDPLIEPARLVMNNHQPVISPGDDIMQAAKVMVNHGVRVVVVAKNAELLGLLTLDDIAQESLAIAALVFSKTLQPHASRETEV